MWSLTFTHCLQVAVLQVDKLVLGVEPDSKTAAAAAGNTIAAADIARTAAAGARKASNGMYNHKLEQQTTCLIEKAQQLAADANRWVLKGT